MSARLPQFRRCRLARMLLPVLGAAVLLTCVVSQVTGQEEEEQEVDLRLPPRVIAVDPPENATGVDTALTEISVTFDRPMKDESWSWMTLRACGRYPGVRDGGGPSYNEDRTICTLPVSLTEGEVYAVGINSPSHTGFRGEDDVPAVNFGWSFGTGDETEEGMSPRVVESEPKNGAVDVDPGLTEISVTFNREMKQEGMSWVMQSGRGAFPGDRAAPPPSFDDTNTTCALNVKLAPGTVYALSINSFRHTGFRDTNGTNGWAAVPYGWTFRTAD